MTATARAHLGQELEIRLIRVLSSHVRHRYFVDVGAERGAFAQAMFESGLRGALFEPLPRHGEALAGLAARYGSRAFAFAIDEADGERDLNVATDAAGNELDFFHSLQKVEGAAQFRHSRSVRVQCRSLRSLAADGTIPSELGILKTDTEGHDLGVLRGLGALRPELVVCEYFTEGLYPGWDDARPELAIAHMQGLGYAHCLATKRVDELEYCSFYPTGFVPRQWGNLFFLRDELLASARTDLVRFLTEVEAALVAAVRDTNADRVAKEAVIQGLLAR